MRSILGSALGIVLPAFLILAGLLVLTGCFFVPTFNVTETGTNLAAKVGDANSRRPIRVGLATRDQIVAMFGKPPYCDDTGRRIGYAWTVKNGVWVYPFCFTARSQIGDRGIELDFNDKGILERFYLFAADDRPMPIMGLEMGNPLLPRRSPFGQELHPNDADLRRKHY